MPITKYVWDGDNLLAETDGNDTVTTVYTNEPQPYGNLVSQRSGLTTSYFHFDALGSTRQLTTVAGVVTDTFTYNAWGEEVARTGTTATPFRWIGELGYYWDSERALFYVRRRSYSGPLGRWFQREPRRAIILSIYTYFSNNPAIMAEPSGFAPVGPLPPRPRPLEFPPDTISEEDEPQDEPPPPPPDPYGVCNPDETPVPRPNYTPVPNGCSAGEIFGDPNCPNGGAYFKDVRDTMTSATGPAIYLRGSAMTYSGNNCARRAWQQPVKSRTSAQALISLDATEWLVLT